MIHLISEQQHYRSLVIKTIIASAVGLPFFFLAMFDAFPSLQTNLGYWINICLGLITLGILAYSGKHFFVGTWKSFCAHTANMDTLIAIGTGAAWLYSMIVILFAAYLPVISQHVYFEAAVVIIALVNLGTLLELRARRHTSSAIQKLMRLQPKTARMVQENHEIDVPIETLKMDDLIRVRPGEQVPVDGVIVEGSSNIDESMLTGEMIPKQKNINDKIFSGTLNKSGSFIFKSTRVGKDTILSQIISLVEQAQNSKPALAKLADQISAIFVPTVLIIATLTALIWFNTNIESKAAYMLVTAMSVLIIACPCALGLAVPISVMVGVGKAAESGILIRHADALQMAGKLTTIVLDKTGTITQGKPVVTGIYPTQQSNAQKLLIYAASLEANSEHPLAEAIVQAAIKQGYSLRSVTDFQAITGFGAQGMIDKQLIVIGNQNFMLQNNIALDTWKEEGEVLARQAQTPLYIACSNTLLGIIAISDPFKPDSAQAIAQLQERGLKIIMITGDHLATAKVIASQVRISQVLAEVLPQDKTQKIAELQKAGDIVSMVGDGINDAPALAQADVGFAMHSGTDIAMESADITLLHNSLQSVVDAISISQQTIKNMKQNLWGAFIYNVLGIPIAAGILFPLTGTLMNPMLAGLAMALSSVTVVTNANRLRLFKP
jgi:Cu+-exporting ATPase